MVPKRTSYEKEKNNRIMAKGREKRHEKIDRDCQDGINRYALLYMFCVKERGRSSLRNHPLNTTDMHSHSKITYSYVMVAP